jgi:hypothetical protein
VPQCASVRLAYADLLACTGYSYETSSCLPF